MSVKIFVPRDSTALALGADEVAAAISAEAARRGIEIELVRNGSRGMFWLEPLVEVGIESGRVAYGPVGPDDVASLFDAQFTEGGAHRLALGKTDEIQAKIRPADWNEYRIVAKGGHLQHFINGVQTVDVTDETAVGAKKGVLALQLHAGTPMTVQFKDIVLKEIK